jgi:hypothetical protein
LREGYISMFTLFNPPFSGSLLIYSALGLLILALILLMVFIFKRSRRIILRLRRRRVDSVGIIASTLRLLFILLLITVSLTMLFLGAFIQSYTAFTRRELAATVRCTPVRGTEDVMILNLATIKSPETAFIRRYRLRGQQWSIEGNILKWDDWLNFIGLHTMYKLTRVRGRYLRTEDEINKPATVYSLVADEEDPRWRWLYEYGARLPFVEAVYGNTVFTFPSETKTFGIYVTTSGFMISEEEQ